jgi:hypothetical protein
MLQTHWRLQLRHHNLKAEVGWLARQRFFARNVRYELGLRVGAVGILVERFDIVEDNSCDVSKHFLWSIAASCDLVYRRNSTCLDTSRASTLSCFVVCAGAARVRLKVDRVGGLDDFKSLVGDWVWVLGVRVVRDYICVLHSLSLVLF